MRTRYRFRDVAILYVATVAALALIGVALDVDGVRQLAVVLTYPTGVVLSLAPLLILLGPSAPAWLETAAVVLLSGLALANAFVVRALLRRWAAGGRVGAGVERRLTEALLAGRIPVTPMAGPSGMVRSDAGESRWRQSLLLRDLPVPVEVLFDTYRDLWVRAGHRVAEQNVGRRALRAYDDEGHEFALTIEPLDVVLQVTSPPVRDRGFVPGLLTGVVPQALLLVCAVGLMVAASAGADPELAYLVFPILSALLGLAGVSVLAGLACTLGHLTRQFGKGLLLGAGTPAGIVAGYLAVVLH